MHKQRISFLIFLSAICSWLLAATFIYSSLYVNQRPQPKKRYKVGFLIMATGRYINFVKPLIDSAKKYFCTNHDVTYFVFTDGQLPQLNNVELIYQPQLGWPYDTMMRFAVYYKNRKLFAHCDYLFSCDADMYFVADVGDEIFFDLVATIQSNYMFDRKPYETDPISTSCIHRGQGSHYFAGAFYGGKHEEFVKLIYTNKKNIEVDLARGVVARVNDESHLNRYFVDHKPSLILSPSYCHFEHWSSPYKRKLIARDGKDGSMRKLSTMSPFYYNRQYIKKKISTYAKQGDHGATEKYI